MSQNWERKQGQEGQRISNKMNKKRSMPRHIIFEMAKIKDKERIFKKQQRKGN